MNEFNKLLERLEEAYKDKYEGRGEHFHMESIHDKEITEIKMELRSFVRRKLK